MSDSSTLEVSIVPATGPTPTAEAPVQIGAVNVVNPTLLWVMREVAKRTAMSVGRHVVLVPIKFWDAY